MRQRANLLQVRLRLVVVASLVCICAASGRGWAQGGPAAAGDHSHLSAKEIVGRMLEKNRERSAALDGYQTDRTYKIEYTGTGGDHAGELHVHAEYLGHEHKKLTVTSQTGSPFLCDKVLKKLVADEQEAAADSNRMMMLTPENYEVALLGEEIVPGAESGYGGVTTALPHGAVRTWVLAVTPTRDNKFGYVGKVWISQDDFAIVRVQGEPMKAPSWFLNKSHFDAMYVRRAGIWLPAHNSSTSHIRIGGEAKLSIDYGSYPVVAARAIKPTSQTLSLMRVNQGAAVAQ